MAHTRMCALAVVCAVLSSAELVIGSFANARTLNMVKGAVPASACADKRGFLTMSNMNWGGAETTQSRSASAAEAACIKDKNCKCFNSFGYYTITAPTSYTPYGGLCTYIKQTGTATASARVCADFPGYTTLANTNWQKAKNSQMRNALDAKDACDDNDNCTHFNSFGYYTISAPDAKAYIPYGGLCTYLKDSKY